MPTGYKKDGTKCGNKKGCIPWNKGISISEEQKQRIRETLKKIKRTDEFKKKVSEGLKKAYKEKRIISAMLGKKLSSKTKNKMKLSALRVVKEGRHNFYIDGRTKDKDYIKRRNKIIRQRYEFRKKGVGELSKDVVQQVYENNIKLFGTLTCYLCLKPVKFGDDNLEHKTPLSHDGTNNYENLAIACKSCNCKKGKKTYSEYLIRILEAA